MIKKLMQSIRDYKRPAIETPVFVGIEVLFECALPFVMAQLTGFANSGNYETKLYAQNVKKLLTNDIAPILKRTAEFYTACKTGEAKKFDITFGEVDIPTVTEKAEIMYEAARAAKFAAEADAVKKMATAKSAEGHKSVAEREGIK